MADKVVMPQLGESIAEGTIVKWLKKPGDVVKKDEDLLVISTDKVEAEIPSPSAGVLLSIDVPEGKTVNCGTVLGLVGAAGERPATSSAPAQLAPVAAKSAPATSVPADAYDLVVIGSGPGGYVAAARAGALGLKVAVVERDKLLGGTCLHRGCIPTKALLHAADVVGDIKDAARMGITVEGVKVDWPAVQKHKAQIVSSNAGGVAHLMKSRKVDVVHGFGKLDGPRKVVVTMSDGSGEKVLHARNVLLAVGSKPRELPFAKFDGMGVVSSDHLTGAYDKIPGSLCVIGGGVIGIEFASLFVRLGTKVTVLEMLPRILGPADVDAAQELHKELERQGCDIRVNVKVTAVESAGGVVKTTYQTADGQKAVVESEKLLVAVGRPALTDNIGLEKTKAKVERGFVAVDGYMESAEPGVFAIGDCVNTPWLAHVASAEGLIAVETIAHRLGKHPSLGIGVESLRCIPSRGGQHCAMIRIASALAQAASDKPLRMGRVSSNNLRSSCSDDVRSLRPMALTMSITAKFTGTGTCSASARETISPLSQSTGGSRPLSIACSIDERRRRYFAPTASSTVCFASSPGEPGAMRSSSSSAIHSRSSVPATFSSFTCSATATCTASVMTSRHRRLTKR